MTRQTLLHGYVGRSWKVSYKILDVHAPFSSWEFHNLNWSCPNWSGKPISISRWRKASASALGRYMSGWLSWVGMSKSGSHMLSLKASRSPCWGTKEKTMRKMRKGIRLPLETPSKQESFSKEGTTIWRVRSWLMKYVFRPHCSSHSNRAWFQRVALLEVWKTFEAQHSNSDDIAKVEGMKPIISKRRREDHENGQMVEGIVSVILFFW